MPWFEIWYVATDGHNISVEVQAPSLTGAIRSHLPSPPDTD